MATWDCPYPTGGKRDKPDSRDYTKRYGYHMIPKKERDPKVDLRKYIDTIYDQGGLECCTANALCAAFTLELKRQSKEAKKTYVPYDPSRLFVYYNARVMEDNVSENSGCTLRFALKAMNYIGVCKESLWPYDESKFAVQPTPSAYKNALGNTISKYQRLDQDINQFRACLKAGFPIAFVMEIYGSFVGPENKKKGKMPMPSSDELLSFKPFLHAVLAVGYDDDKDHVIVLNSWGPSFGKNGCFYMPYEYIIDPARCLDFWKIEEVCEKAAQPKNYSTSQK